jgi:hypothetical protein
LPLIFLYQAYTLFVAAALIPCLYKRTHFIARALVNSVMTEHLTSLHNLVRVLKLTLTLSIPTTTPLPAPIPATVILSKVTTLRSGLNQLSPQLASNLYSKVLMNHIIMITKWATSMPCPPAAPPSSTLSCSGGHLPPTPSTPPLKVTQLPPLTWAYQQALQHILTPSQAPKQPPTITSTPMAQPKATPPKARPLPSSH